MTDFTSIVGTLAACCTTASFIPQVYQIIKSRDTAGISIIMYSIFTFGIFLWLLYGILIGDMPIIIANGITLSLTIAVLILTIKSRIKPKKHHANKAPSFDNKTEE